VDYFIIVKAGLAFNCSEFAIIKSRIVNTFSYTQKLNGVSAWILIRFINRRLPAAGIYQAYIPIGIVLAFAA